MAPSGMNDRPRGSQSNSVGKGFGGGKSSWNNNIWGDSNLGGFGDGEWSHPIGDAVVLMRHRTTHQRDRIRRKVRLRFTALHLRVRWMGGTRQPAMEHGQRQPVLSKPWARDIPHPESRQRSQCSSHERKRRQLLLRSAPHHWHRRSWYDSQSPPLSEHCVGGRLAFR